MVCYGTVVHAQSFKGRDNSKIYTKLFVPIGFDVISIIAEGDLTYLIGEDNVPFRLGIKDNQIKIYYDGKEDN